METITQADSQDPVQVRPAGAQVSGARGQGPEHGTELTPDPRPLTPGAPRDPWLLLALIVVLAGVSGIAYDLGFVRPYPLDGYYLVPLLDLAKINSFTAPAANAWALTWIVLFACYYLAFRICPSAANVSASFRRVALAIICGAAAIYCVNLVNMYPVGAADLFDQIFRARITTHYGLNPFLTLPMNVSDDPLFPYVAWRTEGSPYGPLWELLAAGTSWLAGDSLWNNLILFKLLVTLSYGANVALTYGILRAWRPDWALRGTLFFAWNPLVLFEVPGNGHNDSILLTCLLVAIYLFVLGRRTAVLPALMAGALTKFVPILLVPVAAAAIWGDRLRIANYKSRLTAPAAPRGEDDENIAAGVEGYQAAREAPNEYRGVLSRFEAFSNIAIGGVLAVGLALVLYAPFWEGWQTVGALARQSLFTASIPKVVLDILQYDANVPAETAERLVRNAALGLMLVVTLAFTAYIFFNTVRKGPATTVEQRQALISRTLTAFYEIIFVYLAFATLWFQPWYLMWLVALTAPLARYSNANRTVLFCIGGVANYFVWVFIWLWNHTEQRNVHVSAALAVYTLPLFYTVYVLLKRFYTRIDAGPGPGARDPAVSYQA